MGRLRCRRRLPTRIGERSKGMLENVCSSSFRMSFYKVSFGNWSYWAQSLANDWITFSFRCCLLLVRVRWVVKFPPSKVFKISLNLSLKWHKREFLGNFWGDFFGRIFFGGIFLEEFFGSNSYFTLLKSAKLFEYGTNWFVCQDFGFVKILF